MGSLRGRDGTNLSLIMEADLTDIHAAVLFQVGPGRIDDGDVVFLVAYCSKVVS